MKRWLIGGLFTCTVFGSWAAAPAAPTDDEFRVLPEVCVKRLKGTMSRDEMRMYPHLHHYCFGLNFFNRAAKSRDAQSRGFNLRNAIDNFDYMDKHLPIDHWMRPQVYVDKGKAYLQANQGAEAVVLFNKAIRENPAFEPAYLQLINALKGSGEKDSALEVVTAGLRHIPASTLLKRAYFELGGVEPLPNPAATESGGAAQRPIERETGGLDAKPDSFDAKAQAVDQDAGESDELAKGEAAERTAAAARSCRFCPPEEIDERWRESFLGTQED